MGWTTETWYWIKVAFRYSYVWVYSSTDGITWTEEIAYEIAGVPTSAAWTWSEFVGRTIPNMDGLELNSLSQ